MIRFRCNACSHDLEVGERLANSHVNCPQCGWRLQVPAPPEPVALALAELDDPGIATAYRQGLKKGLLLGSSMTLVAVLVLAGVGVLVYLATQT
jgi:DNA-directed RNA polymerase subunit RPC12/RpoP